MNIEDNRFCQFLHQLVILIAKKKKENELNCNRCIMELEELRKDLLMSIREELPNDKNFEKTER
jgi:hypothetical protein